MTYKRFFLILISSFFVSCVSKKDIYYFQDIKSSGPDNKFKFLSIKSGDILDIQINAFNPESTIIFKQSSTQNQQQNLENRMIEGFLVGEDGNVNIPILGDVEAVGHTTQSFAFKLQDMLIPYLKDPNVKIKTLNFRISVLGEVNSPGTYTILQESVSIPQALGLAGDLTINGDRNHVLIVRNEDGQITNEAIDLTKSNFLESPFYFLKQNDVIYVRPNTARVKSSGLVGSVSTVGSLVSIALSIIILITK